MASRANPGYVIDLLWKNLDGCEVHIQQKTNAKSAEET